MRVGKYAIELSNEDKVFFPAAGLTKGDLVEYYRKAAEYILPHTKGRPISMHRFPDGIRKSGFYHKKLPDYFPDWIDSQVVDIEGGSNRQVVIEKAAALVYLANQGCVTPHIWLSRQDKLNSPDRMVFDLDPPGDDFDVVRRSAIAFHDFFDDIGIATFVQITGSSGIHVVVPLRRDSDFDEVRATARSIAEIMVDRHPEELTVEQQKKKRKGRLFLDTNRNAYGQTMVAPYCVRAREGAPVATPLEWKEVKSSKLTPRDFTIRNLFRRMSRREDPWRTIGRSAVSLSSMKEKLKRVTA